VGRLVDVERPAVGREHLELRDHGDEDQEERQRTTLEQLLRGERHVVEVERTGGVVGEDDPDQHQDRDYL